MFLEYIQREKLINFAQQEFGKVTSLTKYRSKLNSNVSYNMTFNLKPNGAYEEAYFYDFEIFPIRIDDMMDDRKIAALNKRYNTFISNCLTGELKIKYDNLASIRESRNNF